MTDNENVFVQSREFRRWLKRWWQADYSVEGCANKGISLSSLPNAPIEFAGRIWPSSHCPPIDLDGNTCENWQQLRRPSIPALLSQHYSGHRVSLGLQGSFVDSHSFDSNHNLTLLLDDACVFDNLSVRNQNYSLQIEARNAFFFGSLTANCSHSDVNISKSTFRGEIAIHAAQQGRLSAQSARLGSNVSLTGIFSRIDLSRAILVGDLQLSGVASVDSLDLSRAHFHKLVTIGRPQSARSSPLELTRSRFSNGLHLNGYKSSHPINARSITVQDNAEFSRIEVPHVGLTSSRLANVKFDACKCSLTANELNAGALRIVEGEFPQIILEHAQFRGSLLIDGVTSTGKLDLVGVNVADKLRVRECTFRIGVFAKNLSVTSSSNFTGSDLGFTAVFEKAEFKNGADFSARSDRADSKADPVVYLGAMDFRTCSFASKHGYTCAKFSGRAFRGKADFQLAAFNGVVYFERDAFDEDVTFRLAEFHHPRTPIGTWQFVKKFPFVRPTPEASRVNYNELLHQHERAFSNLKDCMKSSGSSRFEKKFHIYELRSRRARTDTEVGWAERMFSYLYDLFSGYGESINRPLFFFIAAPMLFAAVYLLMSGSRGWEDFWNALEFSGEQIFRPFFVWAYEPPVEAEVPSQQWRALYLFDSDETRWSAESRAVVVKGVATLESFLAITLSFLLALSVKRRFQVQ